MSDLLVEKAAIISDCGLYRYRLTRRWADGFLLTFVMLNPSVADADIDDPTIRRCMSFARREGAAGVAVVNLFAFRATKPKDLERAAFPVGGDNFLHLEQAIGEVSPFPLVCAWGAHPLASGPGRDLIIGRAKALSIDRFACLGRTQDGSPRHPLYVKSNQPFEAFP